MNRNDFIETSPFENALQFLHPTRIHDL